VINDMRMSTSIVDPEIMLVYIYYALGNGVKLACALIDL
jgi:hypothetical protein